MSRSPAMCSKWRQVLGAAIVMLISSGCREDVGAVQGKVTYQGAALPVGNVTFFGSDNRVVFIPINEDGTYSIDRVPVGNVLVTVETPQVQLPGPGEPPIPESLMTPAYKYPNVRIPPHYKDRRTSGLQLDVQPGTQTFDIQLEDPESVTESAP